MLFPVKECTLLFPKSSRNELSSETAFPIFVRVSERVYRWDPFSFSSFIVTEKYLESLVYTILSKEAPTESLREGGK